MALQAVVGLDLDEVRERVLLLLHQRERERYAQQMAGDFGDFHFIFSLVDRMVPLRS